MTLLRGGLIVLLLLSLAGLSRAADAPATRPVHATAVLVDLSGEVNDFQRDALEKNFAAARSLGASVVILRVNTYGGLATAGLDISRFLKRQTDLHTIAFVDDKAISAGAMIALACDEIVMSPGSTLGDCAPISIENGSVVSLAPTERAKFESPILADFYDSAVRNHYSPLLVESMVSVSRTVHYVQDKDGNRRFVDDATFAQLTAGNQWTPVPGVRDPVDGPDTLLTVGSDSAVKLGLARAIAASPGQLASTRGLQIVASLSPGLGERALDLLSSSLARILLISIFLFAFYTAVHTPGHGAPEAVATIALAVLVGVPLLTGYAQWWEILAILLGLSLLAIEVFVIPGTAVTGLLGAALVLFGLTLCFVGREPGTPGLLPSMPGTWAAIQKALAVLVGGMVGSLFLWFWLSRYLPRLPYVNRLILSTPAGPATLSDAEPPPEEPWPTPGLLGSTTTDLRPAGRAAFFDPVLGDTRVIEVVSDSGHLPAGTPVTIASVNRNRILVVRT